MTGARPESPPLLLHAFATFVAAGPQVRATLLMAAFGPAYRHAIVAMDGRGEAASLLPAGVEAEMIDPPAERGMARRALAMRRLLARERPDLLLTYNWGSFDAVLAARALPGLPHVHHEDGFNADEARQQKARRVLARRLCLPRCRRVVVCSRRLLAIALESWKLEPGRVRLIPNGVRGESFSPGPSAVRERLDLPAGALVIGTVGHLRPVKNVARLIEAFALLQEDGAGGPFLLIVGDGPERGRLEELARSLREAAPRVRFAGHQAELLPYYRACDVFALSSDSEQHPLALLEALACGLPAASTDVGDVRVLLPPEQGRFLAPASAAPDAAALARPLAELLGDRALRVRLGALNRAHVLEHYSFEGMRDAYREVYDAALAGA
ncbi:MAG: glycosyltransferase family 4 protein [Planctomycetes bacterium]|nr:glycosyltransferase family 4 protein [Planctomycetota bacterium]